MPKGFRELFRAEAGVGFLTLLWIVLGGYVSQFPAETDMAKALYFCGFAVTGVVFFVLGIRQSHKAQQAEQDRQIAEEDAKRARGELAASVANLTAMTQMIYRNTVTSWETDRSQGLKVPSATTMKLFTTAAHVAPQLKYLAMPTGNLGNLSAQDAAKVLDGWLKEAAELDAGSEPPYNIRAQSSQHGPEEPPKGSASSSS